jgi:hypothetical protein
MSTIRRSRSAATFRCVRSVHFALLIDNRRGERFEREAKTLSHLNHRQVCALYDALRAYVGAADL